MFSRGNLGLRGKERRLTFPSQRLVTEPKQIMDVENSRLQMSSSVCLPSATALNIQGLSKDMVNWYIKI